MVKKILVFLSVALLSCTAFAACGTMYRRAPVSSSDPRRIAQTGPGVPGPSDEGVLCHRTQARTSRDSRRDPTSR